MKIIPTLLTFAVCFTARAEFGASSGATFNYKANFKTVAQPQGRLSSPDNMGNRTYDDGYVRSDNIPGNPGLTRFYGYDKNAGAQVINGSPGGTLTFNSSQTILDAQQSSSEQSEAQPAIEIYWQEDLTENEKWNIGLRAALRWQRIKLNNTAIHSTTIETLTDTYAYPGGALIADDYDGYPSPTPGFPVIDDTPSTRNITYAAGASDISTREIDADLVAVDFGPTLSFDFTDKLRLSASLGGTIAWIDSEFSYQDGDFSTGKASKNDWLLGAYASADLSYLIGKHWGIFGGAAYTRLENFAQELDGRSAELQFDDSYTVRTGLFFR